MPRMAEHRGGAHPAVFRVTGLPENVSPLSDVSIPVIVRHVLAATGWRMHAPERLEYRQDVTHSAEEHLARVLITKPISATIVCMLPFGRDVPFFLQTLDYSWGRGEQCPLTHLPAISGPFSSTWEQLLQEMQEEMLRETFEFNFRLPPVTTPTTSPVSPPSTWTASPSPAASGNRDTSARSRLQAVPLPPPEGRYQRLFMLPPPEDPEDS